MTLRDLVIYKTFPNNDEPGEPWKRQKQKKEKAGGRLKEWQERKSMYGKTDDKAKNKEKGINRIDMVDY